MLYVGMACAKSHVIRLQNTKTDMIHIQELPLTVDPPLQEGLTPLIYATMTGSSVMANILLEGKHIDLDMQENVGLPVIHSIWYTAHNIWDVNVELLSSFQVGRWSALHFSAENGDSATTYALIKAGANVDLKAKVCGR